MNIKLVDKYNNTYYNSVVKKSIDADCSVLTEESTLLLLLKLIYFSNLIGMAFT